MNTYSMARGDPIADSEPGGDYTCNGWNDNYQDGVPTLCSHELFVQNYIAGGHPRWLGAYEDGMHRDWLFLLVTIPSIPFR
jgi:hypothetical protein